MDANAKRRLTNPWVPAGPGPDRYRRPMTAALVVIAVVALVAIVALVVTAQRAGAGLAKERARANQLEAQVHSLEEAAAAARSTPARPAAGTARPEPATPVPPADEHRATAEPDRPGALDQVGGTAAPEPTTAVRHR